MHAQVMAALRSVPGVEKACSYTLFASRLFAEVESVNTRAHTGRFIFAKAASVNAHAHTGLEGLSTEQLTALREAAKATLPQPYREDGPPLAWEFDDLPQAAIDAGVGVKHRRSEPASIGAGPFKVRQCGGAQSVVGCGSECVGVV